MLAAWNVTLAEAAAGRSASIVTDVAVTAAKRATVRITRPSLDLWSVARQGTAEPVLARVTPSGTAPNWGRGLLASRLGLDARELVRELPRPRSTSATPIAMSTS